MSTSVTVRIVRAFSYFSHLANIAEDQQSIRALRGVESGGRPIEGALARLRAAGVSRTALQRLFETILVSPVLTTMLGRRNPGLWLKWGLSML